MRCCVADAAGACAGAAAAVCAHAGGAATSEKARSVAKPRSGTILIDRLLGAERQTDLVGNVAKMGGGFLCAPGRLPCHELAPTSTRVPPCLPPDSAVGPPLVPGAAHAQPRKA